MTAAEARGARTAVLRALTDLLIAAHSGQTLRVAVDGPDAAGKTILADEVARRLAERGRPVIRASIDAFHHPVSVRRRRGSLSPEGYFFDAFDYDALRRLLLDPLGPSGNRLYRPAAFDFRIDAAVDEPARLAAPDAVLLLDGVFLLREELSACWDLSVFLQISPAESLRRALHRDIELFGSPGAVRDRYLARYLPGQSIYFLHAAPQEHADILIDNESPDAPRILRWPGAATHADLPSTHSSHRTS
ncbi:uridine kinase [Frankia sp. AgB32]|uniref:uridine kinase n=1 Tax=Frankia sp. AgB32 TaxID=631119 RepID=UPI00200EB765|nr:uridine kinase [Frankia sp. AgB32]MCK9893911.1 uridine kinase [Frankia sp. AgB32]